MDLISRQEALDAVKGSIYAKIQIKELPSITPILEEVAAEICDKYCKWPEQWDEEKEGCELCDSEHCRNCPLSRLG